MIAASCFYLQAARKDIATLQTLATQHANAERSASAAGNAVAVAVQAIANASVSVDEESFDEEEDVELDSETESPPPVKSVVTPAVLTNNGTGTGRRIISQPFSICAVYCDNSVRETDWRCRKRGAQAT